MFKSNSKKAGFFGTLLFHLGILLICFFSSIGYTSVEVPLGIEIDFVPYQNLNIVEEINQSLDNIELVDNSTKSYVENLVIDKDEDINIPNEQDTITLTESVNENITSSISLELENALSTLNALDKSKKTEDLSNEIDDMHSESIIENNIIDTNQDGYVLSADRLAVKKVKPNYSCDEFGKVVVRVWVNREGKTIKAEPGIRGTTESATCLFKEAKKAALQTTWTPYLNAPDIQIGQITYNFYKY